MSCPRTQHNVLSKGSNQDGDMEASELTIRPTRLSGIGDTDNPLKVMNISQENLG